MLVEVQATMSRTFSMNIGSLESLKVLVRWGARARQMRRTLVWLSPHAWAIERVLQCVASFGVDSKVVANTRSTSVSLSRSGVPSRGSSSRPSRVCSQTGCPLSYRLHCQFKPSRHYGIAQSVCARQNHSSTLCQRLGRLRSASPAFKSRLFLLRQHQWYNRSSSSHLRSFIQASTQRDKYFFNGL